MQNTEPEQVIPKDDATWWTPAGFKNGLHPGDYLAAIHSPETDWGKRMMQAGYYPWTEYGVDCDPVSVKIWQHQPRDPHLFVELENVETTLSAFFVSAENTDAFMATWMLKFAQQHAAAVTAEKLSMIAKAFVAFVRYGHGEHVIDEAGERSYDDHLHWQNRQRLRREKEAEKEAKEKTK
jgi:hypothetical protein